METGEESLLCDPGSEVLIGGREKGRAKILYGKRKQKFAVARP